MIQIKQNDRRPAAPAILRRGSVVADLTNATSVTFKMRLASRSELTVNAAAYIVDRTAGSVEYRWADGDTTSPGEFLAEWEVLWSDGTTETFPTIDYDHVIIHSDLDGS